MNFDDFRWIVSCRVLFRRYPIFCVRGKPFRNRTKKAEHDTMQKLKENRIIIKKKKIESGGRGERAGDGSPALGASFTSLPFITYKIHPPPPPPQPLRRLAAAARPPAASPCPRRSRRNPPPKVSPPPLVSWFPRFVVGPDSICSERVTGRRIRSGCARGRIWLARVDVVVDAA
jgi:hypothetical protein